MLRQKAYVVGRLELSCGDAASELGVGLVELGVFALEVLELTGYGGVAVQGGEMNGRGLGGGHRISESPSKLHNLGGKVGYLQSSSADSTWCRLNGDAPSAELQHCCCKWLELRSATLCSPGLDRRCYSLVLELSAMAVVAAAVPERPCVRRLTLLQLEMRLSALIPQQSG